MSTYARTVTYVIQVYDRRWRDHNYVERDPYVDNGDEKAVALDLLARCRRLTPQRKYRLIVRIEEEFPVAVPEETQDEGAAQGT